MRTPLWRLAGAAFMLSALIPGGALAVCSPVGLAQMRTVCESGKGDCAGSIQALKTECQQVQAPTSTTDPTSGEVAVNTPAAMLAQVAKLETQYSAPGGPLAGGSNLGKMGSDAKDKAKGDENEGGGAKNQQTPTQVKENAAAHTAEEKLPEQAPPTQTNEIAKQYLDSGSPQDAQRLIGRVLKTDPANPDALSMRAQVKLAAGDSKGALDDARAALKSDPNNAFARMLIGHSDELAAAGGRIPKKLGTDWNNSAEDKIGDARGATGAASGRLGPGYSAHAASLPASSLDSVVISGWTKFRIGDMNGAADAASAAIAKNPGDVQALGLRSAAYNRLGKPLLALADAQAALKTSPKDVVALLECGYAQYQLGLFKEALSSVETALQVDPLNAMGHLYRGMILEKLNRVQDAIASYFKAAELDPSLKPLSDEAVTRLGGAANITGSISARRSPAKIAIWSIALLIALGLLIKGALRAIKPDWATPVTPMR